MKPLKKKSTIPEPPPAAVVPAPAPAPAPKAASPYPRIDLRRIASALAKYESAALQLAGEYPRIPSDDFNPVSRSDIPHPSNFDFSKLEKHFQNIQIAKLITQGNHKRYEIPKYLLLGEQIHEAGGVAQNSDIPAADSLASIKERFRIPGLNPSLRDIYAETGKSAVDEDSAKKSRISKKKKAPEKPVDPYEYLRNMAPGASIEPIVDPKTRSSVIQAKSYPVFLMKVMPGSHKYSVGKICTIFNQTHNKTAFPSSVILVPV